VGLFLKTIMRKIILLFFLLVIITNVFAQEPAKVEAEQTCEVKPNASLLQSLRVSGEPGQQASDGFVCRFPSSKPNREPLFVIDGQRSSENTLKSFKPEDILNIKVLTGDDATSAYGNEGSGGVIVVQTKKNATKRQIRKQERRLKRYERKQEILRMKIEKAETNGHE
jgi:TonB-dependent Receptor Plug Domain